MRQDAVLDNIKDLQEHDRAQRPNFASDRRDIPGTGTCVVHEVRHVGKGCRCTVKILGNGHPTGVTKTGALCLDAVLSVGDVAAYQVKRHDQMILVSGGLSAAAIANIVSQTAVYYPTQYFGKYEGGVKGVYDGS